MHSDVHFAHVWILSYIRHIGMCHPKGVFFKRILLSEKGMENHIVLSEVAWGFQDQATHSHPKILWELPPPPLPPSPPPHLFSSGAPFVGSVVYISACKPMLQVFTANSDRDTIVKNILLRGTVAKLIRFSPKSSHGHVCLRTEVFGIKQLQGIYIVQCLICVL